MDIDEDRPPSPPAPSFVKRSKLRGSRGAAAARTTIGGIEGADASSAGDAVPGPSVSRGAGARQLRGGLDDDDGGSGKAGGVDDEDDGPSVVVRSRGFNAARRNRMQGTQSSMAASAKAAGAPGVEVLRSAAGSAAVSSGAATPQTAGTPPASKPPTSLGESSRLGPATTMLHNVAEDEGTEDFIPIRTRRAPAQSSRSAMPAYDAGEDYMDEDVIIPVYEDQEVLPDPGPMEESDFLKSLNGAQPQYPLHTHHHQPSRLDEPQEHASVKAKHRKPTEMKEEAMLPTLHSASSRLEALLQKADAAIAEYETVVTDAKSTLAVLDEEEAENKKVVSEAGDKEAWFRELEGFIGTIARFLDAKMPLLEAVERDNIALSAQRTRIVQRSRSKDAEDELSLFFGVPTMSLLPPRPDGSRDQDAEVVSLFHSEEAETAPTEDGPALSPLREARRTEAAQRPLDFDSDELSAADRIAFQDARGEVYAQLQKITADVLAPEFLDPAATVADPDDSGAVRLRPHPASLVSRFANWRARYPGEYAGTWGGLALAGAWEFWCRREMADVDVLRPVPRLTSAEPGSQVPGPGLELGLFAWHRHLLAYVADSKVGGDDEAMEAMLGNVVVPRLVALAEGGGFDPWNVRDSVAIIHLVKQIHAGVNPKGWRFQSLLTAYLSVFRTHIATFLRATIELGPAAPPAGVHPGIPAARLSFLRRLVVLFRNLVLWQPFVGDAERGSFSLLIDDFIGRGMWPLLVVARDFGSGHHAQELLSSAPDGSLTPELMSRLSSLAATAR